MNLSSRQLNDNSTINKSWIGRFSSIFVKRYRITLLLFLTTLVFGFFSYSTLLKVEGFPAVEVPIVFMETNYFVNDADKVNQNITAPLEQAAGELAEVKKITSTTTPVGSFVAVEFDQDISSDKGQELLNKQIDKSVTLPSEATLEFRVINAGSLDGKHDLVLNISAPDAKVAQLQEVAGKVAAEVAKNDQIAKAEMLPLIEQKINPLSGRSFDYQTGFNRVGYRDQGGQLIFEKAVAVGVIGKPDTGTVDLSKAVKKELERYQDTGELTGYNVTYGGDFSRAVLHERSSLQSNALIGLISVMLLIFLLIDWRASIVGGIFIPLVFAGVFLTMYLMGYSLNIVALFSLVLVLGIFVDNATVVIDAIERAKEQGFKGLAAIKQSMGVIGTSVIAGTWTTILVFIPMMFISGVLGKFIIFIPITVITALLISLFLTLSVVPWLGNLFIRDKKEGPVGKVSFLSKVNNALNLPSRFVNYLSHKVAKFVNYSINGKIKITIVILIALGLIGWGGSYAAKLNFSIFPPAKDTKQIVLTENFPDGTSVDQAESASARTEKIVRGELGNDLEALTYFVANDKKVYAAIDLTEVGTRQRTSLNMTETLNKKVADFSGARVQFKVQTEGPPEDDYQVNVRVLADKTDLLKKGTDSVKKFLTDRNIGEADRVSEVAVDRFDTLTKINGDRFAVVKAKVSDPKKTNLALDLQDQINREYSADKLKSLGLAGNAVVVDLGTEGKNVDSFKSAGIALAIALVVMYGLLVLQFNSFVQPLLIFLAIPFSFPLLFPALFGTDNALSFFVMLGIIALAGVVVNNTIMLTHQANLLRRDGKSAREAIATSVGIRFRALLATSLTTMAGLLPLSLSEPFWEPLSYTIIFGLASSVLLVIFVFPAFYIVFESIRDWSHRLVHRAGEHTDRASAE